MMDFRLRPMTVEDIEQVVEIEKCSFPTPWSPYAFMCELGDNEFAYYLVVVPHHEPQKVVGYGGMWIIVDEAHITNIAVSPDFRGRALGEMVINGLTQLALLKHVQRMTLEVRVSNQSAQRLYERLGFSSVGIRPGYYVDTREDAMIMWRTITSLIDKEG